MNTTDTQTSNPRSIPNQTTLPTHLCGHIDRLRTTREFNADGGTPSLRYTPLGTPCSRLWDDAWIEKVHTSEQNLNRRVCGARTQAGTVCTLESDHASGRCRFHGGFELTGAPKGNRNHVVHGLYSRRLLVCGEHCPMWNSCPCAGPDVKAMEPKERPTCPYEQTEYNALVTDGMSLVERRADANPLDKQAVHMLALLQVMMSRAAATLGTHKLTQMIVTVNCQRHDERMNPAFAALMRLMWEYRHVRRLLPDSDNGAGATPESVAKQVLRMEADTDRAVAEASEENAERAFGLYERSRALSPDEDGARLARVRLAYREGKRNISRELRQRQAGVKRMADAEKRFGELVEEGDDSEDAGDDP